MPRLAFAEVLIPTPSQFYNRGEAVSQLKLVKKRSNLCGGLLYFLLDGFIFLVKLSRVWNG